MISKLYQSTSLHALFRKSQFTIFAITFSFALLRLSQFLFYYGNLCQTEFAIA